MPTLPNPSYTSSNSVTHLDLEFGSLDIPLQPLSRFSQHIGSHLTYLRIETQKRKVKYSASMVS